MIYQNLGRSGLKLSRLSFGSWVTFGQQLDVTQVKSFLKLAYETGVNFFDNAEVYGAGQSEVLMGQALKELHFPRETFCVSSKVFWGGDHPTQNGLSRKHVVEACHAALKRLQVEHLDLYFCHRPDPSTPILETVWAMNDLIQQGKVLYWGTSEWDAQQITEAHLVAREWRLIPPTMEQSEYNLFHRKRFERDYAPVFERFGMGTTTWSPLASGILSGKYADGIPDDSRLNLPGYEWLRARYETPDGRSRIQKASQFAALARELGVTSAQLGVAWCLKNPHVSTVILGASKIEQLRETLKSIEVLRLLTPEVNEKIEQIFQNKPEPLPTYLD
jgi:voltage-dependent potassium channel beta subunit